MFGTGAYAKANPPRYDELGRVTTRTDVKLSHLLQTFRCTNPLLLLRRMDAEHLVSVFPSGPIVSMDDALNEKERGYFRPASSSASPICLISQSDPVPDPISLEERSARLQSAYPELDAGTWDDLWRLLCGFRLPDRALVIAGTPLTKTDGTQCLAISLHRFIVFCPYEQGHFRIPSKILQDNNLWWLARPRP